MRTTFKNELIKKGGAIFVFVLITFYATSLFAEPNVAWIRRYNGPVNRTDMAVKMALDSRDNVYIVGTSQPEIVTIKYDKYGNLLWDRHYGGPGGGNSSAVGVGVDSNGNVYIGGSSVGSGGSNDYTVVKYGSGGNQTWVARYNASSNGTNIVESFAADRLGNSYVTGSSYVGGLRNYDGAVVKVDSQGSVGLAVFRDSGPGSWDVVRRMASDAKGSLYIAGGNLYSSQIFDKLTHWSVVTTWPVQAIAIDSVQNAYVTSLLGDYIVNKYDSSGSLKWSKIYNGPANGSEWVYDMVLGAEANVHISGRSPGVGSGNDFATVKYDSSGNERWIQRYNGPSNGDDEARGVAVDKKGNVYVVGTSWQSGAETDIVTIKYDSSGNEKWVHRYNGPFSGNDYGVDVVVNSYGDVYVTGHSIDYTSSYDIVTIKFASHLKGDLDGDGVLTPNDVVFQLNCVFLGEGYCPPSAAELNCDDKLTPADLVILLLYFYAGFSPPC